jgi:hypothetical protein
VLHDDNMGEENGPRRVPETFGDATRRAWYTAFPTLYVDEDSTESELLWQIVLELRSLRTVLIACAIVTPLLLTIGIVIGLTVFS